MRAGRAGARESGLNEAVPAPLLLWIPAVQGGSVVKSMDALDQVVVPIEDPADLLDDLLRAGERLCLKGHQVNEHVAAKQGYEVIVTLFMMQHSGLKFRRPTKHPCVDIALPALQNDAHRNIVSEPKSGWACPGYMFSVQCVSVGGAQLCSCRRDTRSRVRAGPWSAEVPPSKRATKAGESRWHKPPSYDAGLRLSGPDRCRQA